MRKSSILFLFLLLGFMFMPNVVKADTQEIEPNNSKTEAQKVSLGTYYSASMQSEDVDCFKYSFKNGEYYKIHIEFIGRRNLETNDYEDDAKDYSDMYISLDPTGDTSDEYFGEDVDFTEKSYLFKADYTGSYYFSVIQSYYSDYETNYRFVITEYDPFGSVITDSQNNQYMVIGNNDVELMKANKSIKEYDSDDIRPITLNKIPIMNEVSFNVSAIGDSAFKGSNLTYLSISAPDIDAKAFYNCKKLKTVKLYGRSIYIGSKAFYGCSKLEELEFDSNSTLKSIGKNALKGTKKGIEITISGSGKKYNKQKKMIKKSGVKKPHYLIYL